MMYRHTMLTEREQFLTVMDYKLIVLDIDGTLTNSKKEITPRTKEALIKIQEQGVYVAIASGRPTPGTKKVAQELELERFGNYVLSFNGGRVINCKTGEVVLDKTIPAEMAWELCDVARENGVGIMTYDSECALAGTDTIDKYMELEARINSIELKQVGHFKNYVDFPVNKCLMTGEPDHLVELEKKLKEKYAGKLNIFRSEPFFLELMPKGIDKAAVLKNFLPFLGIARDEVICCGDGYNDKTMIEFAGLGVAMANAREEVKEVADYITSSNDEDGIAKVVEKYILK